MLIDYNTRLTPTAQSFSGSGAVSTNALPLVQAGRDFAVGTPMAMVFTVTTSAALAGTETYLFRVQTATASDGTTGAVILASTPTYTVAGGAIAGRADALAAGSKVVLPIPPGAIQPTATHLAGFVVTGSSGTISCLIDVVPLETVENIVFYDGKPDFAA